MGHSRKEQVSAVIEELNAIQVGELSTIESKLASIRQDLGTLGERELERTVAAAGSELVRGDAANFRRLLAQAVSRLGHLK